MTELIWSPQALRDLEGVRAYIALDSPRYADLTVRRVVAAVERLKTFPESADGEAKFWIDPTVELAVNFGLKPKQVADVQKLIEEHLNEIRDAWARHFPSGSH